MKMSVAAAALLLLLPAAASAIDEILMVTGPGREAPVMEDSDKIPVWDLTMEHRWRGIQGMSLALLSFLSKNYLVKTPRP